MVRGAELNSMVTEDPGVGAGFKTFPPPVQPLTGPFWSIKRLAGLGPKLVHTTFEPTTMVTAVLSKPVVVDSLMEYIKGGVGVGGGIGVLTGCLSQAE